MSERGSVANTVFPAGFCLVFTGILIQDEDTFSGSKRRRLALRAIIAVNFTAANYLTKRFS